MNNYLKYGMIALVVFILILQLFGPSRPELAPVNGNDLISAEQLQGDVVYLLKGACYDCHSMQSRYPWYANVALISWSIYEHIEHGREELNFSNWGSLSKRTKLRKLKDIKEEVGELDMPLASYVLMHPEADLTEEQRQLLIDWAGELARQVLSE